MFNNSVNLMTILRMTTPHGCHTIIKDKPRHSKMSEVCRAKWKWRFGEPPRPRKHRTLTSHHVLPTQMLLEMHIYRFLLWFHQTGILIESLAIGACSQSQCPLLSPELQKVHTCSHTINDACNHIYDWTLLRSLSMTCLHTYERQEIPTVSGSLGHEPSKDQICK